MESIIDELFNDTSFEDEELDKEIIGELSEEEKQIVDGPTDEEDGADETELAEESARLYGEVRLMDMAMRTAEEYIWNVSEEAEGEKGAKKQNILKKIWEWLKKVLGKLSLFLVTVFKRFQIWLAGDLKDITKWAADNKEDLSKILSGKGAKVIRKMVIIKGNWDDILHPLWSDNPVSLRIREEFNDARAKLEAGKGDPELAEKLENFADSISIKSMTTAFYGENPKSKEVSIVEFNDKFPIAHNLIVYCVDYTKYTTRRLKETIKSNKIFIATVKKNIKVKDADAKDVKELARAAYKYLNSVSTQIYWILQLYYKLVKDAYIFAKMAIAANKSEEEGKA